MSWKIYIECEALTLRLDQLYRERRGQSTEAYNVREKLYDLCDCLTDQEKDDLEESAIRLNKTNNLEDRKQ